MVDSRSLSIADFSASSSSLRSTTRVPFRIGVAYPLRLEEVVLGDLHADLGRGIVGHHGDDLVALDGLPLLDAQFLQHRTAIGVVGDHHRAGRSLGIAARDQGAAGLQHGRRAIGGLLAARNPCRSHGNGDHRDRPGHDPFHRSAARHDRCPVLALRRVTICAKNDYFSMGSTPNPAPI
jgi:hypothetical protein